MEFLVGGIALLVGLCVGAFVGIFMGVGRMQKAVEDQSVGNLRIDRSEPDEPPKPFLEVTNATIETISQKKFVILKVVNENYISQN